MTHLFDGIADFIARHHLWSAPVLGAITLLESLVVVGAFVPATALMVLAGGLIATGAIDGVPVVLWCVAGAIIGDAISFALGRRMGPAALRGAAFKKHRRQVARTRLFVRRYGMVAIFIGRFFGPLRAFVPVVAGMFRMRKRAFQTANAVSAVFWVLLILSPGYFAMKGLAQLEVLSEADALTIGVIVFVVTAALGVIVWRFVIPRLGKPTPRLVVRPAE
jgi:membrane protein DedA with SNARE-associated domain